MAGKHPEITHIVGVLTNVKNVHLGSKPIKIKEQNHRKGANRIRNNDLEHLALAIYEKGKSSPKKEIPNFIKNYFPEANVQRAFKILEHVSKLDTKLIQTIKKNPGDYGPRVQ